MSSVTEEMVFNDLTPIEVPVQIKGDKYVLCEATAEAAAKYRNHAMSCATFGADGVPNGVKGLGDIQAILVSACLFKLVPNGAVTVREPVTLDFVRKLTERIVKPLFERAKSISELGEDTDESIEALEKQIGELQKKLDAARAKETLLKNGSSSTEEQSQ